MTLDGARFTAPRIEGLIDGNLYIGSRQDESKYNSKQRNVSGGVSACVPPACYGPSSVSGGFGGTNIDSSFKSVGQKSGLFAGDDGFNVVVNGHAVMHGGVITSTEKAQAAGKNHFDSKTLVVTDILNELSYHGDGFQANASVAGGGSQAKTDAEKDRVGNPSGGSDGANAGAGHDGGYERSITRGGVTGHGDHGDVRTDDPETGLNPKFDKDRMNRELAAQEEITRTLSQLAVPIASAYADRKATDARKNGDEDGAQKWDEGGVYRAGMYGALGFLTGGIQGAIGSTTSASLMPYFGEKIAELNLPVPVRTSLDFVVGSALGSMGGGVNGAVAALPQTALNYVSHSPFQEVRIAVSKENARLENLCGLNCTEADFRRIDEQIRKIEVAMDLAHTAAHSELTSEQMKSFAQVVTEVMPGYGTAESFAQLVTGKNTLPKLTNKGVNTMFPTSWSEARTKIELDEAWKNPNKVIDGNSWTSVTPSGVSVMGFLSPKFTVFPLYLP